MRSSLHHDYFFLKKKKPYSFYLFICLLITKWCVNPIVLYFIRSAAGYRSTIVVISIVAYK